jgi:nucleotide-binding universal stress UspA family protein
MSATSSTIETAARNAEAVFQRILVPIDLSEGSRRALVTALALKRSFGSEVHLFRLTESTANDEFLGGIGGNHQTSNELVESAEARLLRFAENVIPGSSRDVIAHAQVGVDVVHGVGRSAKRVGATLVILAQEPKETLFRSAVEKIARDLDSAVMILKWSSAAA